MGTFVIGVIQSLVTGAVSGAAVWLRVKGRQEKQHRQQMRYLKAIHANTAEADPADSVTGGDHIDPRGTVVVGSHGSSVSSGNGS
jgi:hypothetical protein